MVKSLAFWLLALSIGVIIHVDWHLGRPLHDHLSFGLRYHWLLAIATFAPLPWLISRRWPTTVLAASAFTILTGVVLGQGLEPLSEVMLFSGNWGPFTNPVRWRVFAEFMVAGTLTYAVSAIIQWRHASANRRAQTALGPL